jgi:hypothetical protein
MDEEVCKEAGALHSEIPKSKLDCRLADAYVLAVARRMRSGILIGNVHLKGIKGAILI